jgi:predicted nucleic acid-binding protein
VTVYVDTSDLVKLYFDEAGSEAIRQLVERTDVLATSVVAYAETRSTFARRRRERFLSRAQHAAAVTQFDLDWPRIVSIPVDADLARSAGRMADRLGIRGFDAIHLASFERLASHSEGELIFSSSDERLVKAARRLG